MRTRSLWPIGFLLACSAVNGAKQHAICASSGCILSDTPSNTSIGVLLRRSDIDVASLLLLEGSFSLATPVPGQDSSFLASYLGDFPDQVKQLPGAGFNYTVEGNEAEVKMNGTTQVMAFSGPDYSNAGPSANDSVRSLLILDGHFVVFSLGPSPGENGTITQRKMSVWDSVPDVSQWNLAGKSLSLESVQSEIVTTNSTEWCPRKEFMKDTTCTACDASCETCFGDGTDACLSCPKDYRVAKGACVKAECKSGIMAQQLELCLEDLVPASAQENTPKAKDTIPVVIPIAAVIATVVLIVLLWLICRRRKKLSAATKAAWLEASLKSGTSNKNSFHMGAVNSPPAYQTSSEGYDPQQYMARPEYNRTPSYTEEVYSFAPESDGGPGLDDPEWQARERELQARVELELQKKRFEIKRQQYEAKLRAHLKNRDSRTNDEEDCFEEEEEDEESSEQSTPSPVRTPRKFAHKRSRSTEDPDVRRMAEHARRPASKKNESLPRHSALVAESPEAVTTPTSGKLSGIKAWVNSPKAIPPPPTTIVSTPAKPAPVAQGHRRNLSEGSKGHSRKGSTAIDVWLMKKGPASPFAQAESAAPSMAWQMSPDASTSIAPTSISRNGQKMERIRRHAREKSVGSPGSSKKTDSVQG